MIKITCVHTAAGPAVIALIEREIKTAVGVPCVVSHLTLPEVIADVVDHGRVTEAAAAKLLRAYDFCRSTGTDIVLNVCSSVGAIADKARDVYAVAGMPLVRIDEAMCREAVKRHRRIGMMGTLSTTLEPSVDLLVKVAGESGAEISVRPILAEGGFGKSQEELNRLLCDTLDRNMADLDAVVLAQASMALAEDELVASSGLPVYSSPGCAAKQLALLVKDMRL